MKAKDLPSMEYLRACFHYNPESGVLRWRCRPREHFASMRSHRTFLASFMGHVCGSIKKNPRPFIHVKLDDQLYVAHRIIWTLVNGPIPEGLDIDHKNRNSLDNRLSNLRLATGEQNARNGHVRKSNTTGVRGVGRTRCGNWCAHIGRDGKLIHLGTFQTKGMAAVAYAKASLRMSGIFSPFCHKYKQAA